MHHYFIKHVKKIEHSLLLSTEKKTPHLNYLKCMYEYMLQLPSKQFTIEKKIKEFYQMIY